MCTSVSGPLERKGRVFTCLDGHVPGQFIVFSLVPFRSETLLQMVNSLSTEHTFGGVATKNRPTQTSKTSLPSRFQCCSQFCTCLLPWYATRASNSPPKPLPFLWRSKDHRYSIVLASCPIACGATGGGRREERVERGRYSSV